MLNKIISTKAALVARSLLQKIKAPAHDWSQIYDGIYKF